VVARLLWELWEKMAGPGGRKVWSLRPKVYNEKGVHAMGLKAGVKSPSDDDSKRHVG
jgi:hypothetical protein